MRIDTGGTGKGLAADALAHRLRGYRRFMVDCGGDLRVGGAGVAETPYDVEVQHPLTGEHAHVLRLDGGGVATSGLDVRLWRRADGGGFAHHLLDPSTGEPAWTGLIGVTALGATTLEAETLSKLALLSGPERARASARRARRPPRPRQRRRRAGRAAARPPAPARAGRRPASGSGGGMTGATSISQHGWWLAGRASGVVALALVTLSVGIGLTMSARLMRRPGLARRLTAVHEQAALAGLVAIAVHGLTLLGDPWLHPGLSGITVPFAAAYRPFWTGLGIIGGWLAAVLGLSFYVRRWIGPRLWRACPSRDRRRLRRCPWSTRSAREPTPARRGCAGR